MRDAHNIGETMLEDVPEKARKSGRPRVIPASVSGTVAHWYRRGYGYRSIARLLAEQYHINYDYSSVKRALLRMGIIARNRMGE